MKWIYRKNKIIITLCVIAVLSIYFYSSNIQAETQKEKENLKLYSISACLIDASSGRVLYEKNGYEIRPMASTTKIMTCILALEKGTLDDIVTVSSLAASQPDVQLNINTNEQYYLKDLLYSLMLESHNDAAVAIAEHIGGSVEGFAALMNEKAAFLGCRDTFFVTPNGLDKSVLMEVKKEDGTIESQERAHSTTAFDLAQIMRYCIMQSEQKEQFLEITRTQSYSFSNIKGTRQFTVNNHNAFLSMMDGALSGKTGFTSAAGYCYIGAVKQGDRTLIAALLGCGWPNHKTYKWSDMKTLVNYGFEHFKLIKLSEVPIDETKLQPILVKGGCTNRLGDSAFTELEVIAEQTRQDEMLIGKEEQIRVSYQLKKDLEAPIKKGQQLGTITYSIEEETIKVDSIVAKNEIKQIDYTWCIKQIYSHFFFLAP